METLPHKLLELVSCSWKAQAVHVAAELRLADLLAEGPKRGEELAALTGAHAPSLCRLLRALTTIDICRQTDDGSFEMTALGALLRAEDPDSLRCWTIWWGAYLWPVWGHLLYSVKTGQSARKLLLGTEGFEHLEQDVEAAAIFNRAAAELTRLTAEQVVRSYDFTGLKRIVDVGGGCGELIATILREYPEAHGVLFDLRHAVDQGRRHIEAAGLAARCEIVAGSFFESVPPGADACILKSVIHDWNDDRSRLIFENCRKSLQDHGRLLVMEEMLPSRCQPTPAHQSVVRSDLNMLVALGAQERTETQLRELLELSGFRVSRIVPAGPSFSIIEAFAA